MAIFVTVQTSSPKGIYRLNVDHIVSYTQGEHTGPGVNITLSTGGSVNVALSPEKLDALLRDAKNTVFDLNNRAV